MQTYVILSKLSPEALKDPSIYREMADKVSKKIKSECPGVHWKQSYAVLGRFDVVDIVESDDPKQVEKAAMIIRAYGNSTTETLFATPWHEFLDML
ncbi:MAG: GYD domain-containing protein [Desulfomonilia bacterium]